MVWGADGTSILAPRFFLGSMLVPCRCADCLRILPVIVHVFAKRSSRGERTLAAELRSVGRIGARLLPPKTARTELPSTTARDQSICLIILSILAYVVFEIVQMFLYSWMSWRYADEVAKKGLAVALYENRRREKRIRASHLLLWLITFVIAALAGFSATGILVYAFCRRLFRLG